MKEFVSAVKEVAAEADGTPVDEQYVEFKLDGRVMRAFQPTEGQLTFMMAAMGRGQTADQRFASIINIMMESLRAEDQDYLESRLLTRDPARQLPMEQIEEIFAHLTEEWFGRPTQPSSGSTGSEQTTGTD